MYEYYDKFGNKIKEEDTLVHESGEEEIVIKCGEDNLGFNADNPNSPYSLNQAYPLSEFDLSEWHISGRNSLNDADCEEGYL